MMTTCVRRSYYCESAHYLPHVPEGHKCKNLHGHHYQINVEVDGDLDKTGWIMDFWDLDAIFKPLLDKMDHKCLNDIEGLDNPTAEVIAGWIYARLQPLIIEANPKLFLSAVEVFETRDCSAVVRAY